MPRAVPVRSCECLLMMLSLNLPSRRLMFDVLLMLFILLLCFVISDWVQLVSSVLLLLVIPWRCNVAASTPETRELLGLAKKSERVFRSPKKTGRAFCWGGGRANRLDGPPCFEASVEVCESGHGRVEGRHTACGSQRRGAGEAPERASSPYSLSGRHRSLVNSVRAQLGKLFR